MKNDLLKNVAISALTAEIAAFVFLLVSSFLTYKSEDPDFWSGSLGISGLIFGSVVCGLVCGLIKCQWQIAASLLSASLYLGIQFVSASIFSKDSFSPVEAIIKALSVMTVSFIISRLIQSRNQKRRKRRHSRR